MIDKKLIEDRIKEIRKRRKLLEKYQEMDFEEFSSDLEIYELALRHLQVMIQAAMDIGKHIAAVKNFEAPEKASKIFTILSDNSVINNDLAEELNKAGGARNIIVHEYLGINLQKIYHHIQTDLSDFDQFVVEIDKFISS
jgi:uncharacterized protein YutE (UPF0331/DUF86 family)